MTDVATGYAEPGYGRLRDDDPVIVFGNWNDHTRYVNGEHIILSDVPSRLARSLERVGAEIEWCDEWTTCSSCYRAVRTESDSYHWRPSYLWVEDTGPLCSACLIADGEDAILGYGREDASYVNNPRMALAWCDAQHVESFGFAKWEPGDEHTYESGWHPGQTDDPARILAALLEVHPSAEVVFFLDESSQFYIRFSAYFRIPADESTDDSEDGAE